METSNDKNSQSLKARFFEVWDKLLRYGFWVWWPCTCLVQAASGPSTLDAIIDLSALLTGDETGLSYAFDMVTSLLFFSWIMLWPITAITVSKVLFQERFFLLIHGIWVGVHAIFIIAYDKGLVGV